MNTIERVIAQTDWITIVVFVSVLFLVIAKGLFYNRFMSFMVLPFNSKYIFVYNKKNKLFNWFHIFMTLFSVINLSLFLYFAYQIFYITVPKSDPLVYSIILGITLIFVLLKILLQLGNGFIFNSNRNISEFIFKKLSYFNYSGLLMFASNIFLCFVAKGSKTVFFISIFLILLMNVIGWVTVVKNHQKYLAANFFYFILYLCALEIAPYLIIGSYLKD